MAVINGGTYITQNEGFQVFGEGSKVIMNDGTLQTVECGISASYSANVEMNGGLIQTSDNMGISTNGNAGRGGNTITMNGGKIDASIKTSGYEAIGIYIANSDTFIMNGGEVVANGGTGLCMRGGDVTIHGGSITATNTDKNGNVVPDGKIADKNTTMMDCSAVIYDKLAGYSGGENMRLTIDGGTLTAVDHSVQVLSDEAEPKVYVTGGTLTPAYPEPVPNEEPQG